MTYTYNDQAIFEAVPGAKAIIRRPIGMSDKKWAKYADGVVKALDNRAPCTPLERGEAIHKAMLDGAQESPSMKLVDILARELKVWPEGVSCLSQLQHDGAIINGNGYDGREWARLQIAEDTPPAGVLVTEAEWQAAVDALKAADSKPDTARATEARGQAKDELYTLGALIEMGYLRPTDRIETPSYDFSAWPPERFDCGLLPSVYVQSFGRSKRYQPVKAKSQPEEWSGEGMPSVKTVCELSSASKFTEGTNLKEFPAGTRVLVGGKANFGGHDVAVVCVEGRHFCGTIIPSLLRPARTVEQIVEQIAAEQRENAVSEMVDTLKRFNSIHEACGMLYDAGYRLPVNTGK